MSAYLSTGKRERVLDGVYILHTTASKIDFSAGRDRRFMVRLFDYGTDSAVKTFLIESVGVLLVNSTVGTFDLERVGDFSQHNFKRIS